LSSKLSSASNSPTSQPNQGEVPSFSPLSNKASASHANQQIDTSLCSEVIAPAVQSSPVESDPGSQIASLRATVGTLDITQRISLMEAFNRLSRETAELHYNFPLPSAIQSSPLARSKTGSPKPYDEKVLTLLYSPAPSSKFSSPQSSPKHLSIRNSITIEQNALNNSAPAATSGVDHAPMKRARSMVSMTKGNEIPSNNNSIFPATMINPHTIPIKDELSSSSSSSSRRNSSSAAAARSPASFPSIPSPIYVNPNAATHILPSPRRTPRKRNSSEVSKVSMTQA
jgi:hypothetical protein